MFLSHQFSLPIEDNNLPSCEVRFARRTITLTLVYTRANTSASKCWQNIFPISSLQSERHKATITIWSDVLEKMNDILLSKYLNISREDGESQFRLNQTKTMVLQVTLLGREGRV